MKKLTLISFFWNTAFPSFYITQSLLVFWDSLKALNFRRKKLRNTKIPTIVRLTTPKTPFFSNSFTNFFLPPRTNVLFFTNSPKKVRNSMRSPFLFPSSITIFTKSLKVRRFFKNRFRRYTRYPLLNSWPWVEYSFIIPPHRKPYCYFSFSREQSDNLTLQRFNGTSIFFPKQKFKYRYLRARPNFLNLLYYFIHTQNVFRKLLKNIRKNKHYTYGKKIKGLPYGAYFHSRYYHFRSAKLNLQRLIYKAALKSKIKSKYYVPLNNFTYFPIFRIENAPFLLTKTQVDHVDNIDSTEVVGEEMEFTYVFFKNFSTKAQLSSVVSSYLWSQSSTRTASLLLRTTTFLNSEKSRLNSVDLKATQLFSKHRLPFILDMGHLKMFKRFKYRFSFSFSYKIFKSYYSFLKINELKKFTYNYVKQQLFGNLKRHLLYSHRLFRNVVSVEASFSFFNNLSFISNSFSFIPPTDQVYSLHNEVKSLRTLPSRPRGSEQELYLPRVKFKPGYMRLWRHFRLALAEAINFKYIYQQQLTRYISRFSRKALSHYFQFYENRVIPMFIYSGLLPDESTFTIFMNYNLLYLNHKTVTLTSLYVYPNDILQVIVSNWYYIFSRWLTSCLYLRHKKFSKLVFRKSATTRYKSIKQTKQKSFYTPNWIYLVKYDYTVIKSFFEVDFLTLSAYCIYEPTLFLYSSPKDFRVLRYNIIRLYNWKYVN